MATIFMEGFDWVGQNSDLTSRYTSASLVVSGALSTGVTTTTAFADGRAVRVNANPSAAANLIGNNVFGADLPEFFGSFRLARGTLAAGNVASNYAGVSFRDGAANQFSICFDETGAIVVRTGGLTGPIIGSTPAGTVPQNSWASYQFHVVVDAAIGSIEIRRNGLDTLLTLTAVNTQGGTGNPHVNGYAIAAQQSVSGNGVSEIVVDDFFINSVDGSEPTSWPGDVRIRTQAPIAEGSVTNFAPSPAATTFGRTGNSLFTSLATTNAVLAYPLAQIVPYNGMLSSVTFVLSGAFAGSMRVGIYDSSGPAGAPGILLGHTDILTGLLSGAHTVNFLTAFSVTKDTVLYVAFHGTANIPVVGANATLTRYSESRSFVAGLSSPMAAVPTTVTGFVPFATVTVVNPKNFSVVGTPVDGDSSYVASNTVGHTDLYNVAPLPVVPMTIHAVEPFALVRKVDSGLRTSAVRHRSAATEQSVAVNTGIGQSYTFTGEILHTDPATDAAWTVDGVNDQQVGVRVEA